MKKFILLSFILAMIVIPARNARSKDARAGLKRTIIQMAVFDVVYLLLLLYVWPRLG
jgi:hypothetical protein